jgi:anti-sigma regulatory factor (Ser/Thr protein kinase)
MDENRPGGVTFGPRTWTHTFACAIPELRRMSGWVHEVCADAAIDHDLALDLELCLHEVVANVILHGCDHPGGSPISVSLTASRDGVRATVEDFGRAFDPRQVPERPVPATLEDLTPGGRGVEILRRLARDLDYRRDGDRNILTFRVGRT